MKNPRIKNAFVRAGARNGKIAGGFVLARVRVPSMGPNYILKIIEKEKTHFKLGLLRLLNYIFKEMRKATR